MNLFCKALLSPRELYTLIAALLFSEVELRQYMLYEWHVISLEIASSNE